MHDPHISGATRLVALLGDPVAHSISPQIHNHAFRAYGLPLAYVPLNVHASKLNHAVSAIRWCGFAGANVTIPHKRSVAAYCDRVSEISRRIGAVNTLYFDGDRLRGTTTDPEGFFKALMSMGHDCRGDRCVILGNGGTARTLAYALALRQLPSSLTLVGRREERVRPLAEEISAHTDPAVDWTLFDSDSLGTIMKECTLCVNCTSVGMHPHADRSPLAPEYFHDGMTVLDAVYNPAETLFLSHARRAGCTAQNGLRMLLYQGLASQKLWTGTEVDEAIYDMEELQGLVTTGRNNHERNRGHGGAENEPPLHST